MGPAAEHERVPGDAAHLRATRDPDDHGRPPGRLPGPYAAGAHLSWRRPSLDRQRLQPRWLAETSMDDPAWPGDPGRRRQRHRRDGAVLLPRPGKQSARPG